MIHLKRVYDTPEKNDGYRILIDRIWPRGLSKTNAQIDLWLKDIAPSNELRKWFDHDPVKWNEFKQRYFIELNDKSSLLKTIVKKENEHQNVTLLYATKDKNHNNAVALWQKIHT